MSRPRITWAPRTRSPTGKARRRLAASIGLIGWTACATIEPALRDAGAEADERNETPAVTITPWVRRPAPAPLIRQPAQPDHRVSTFRLSNGVRVVVVPRDQSPTVSVRLYFGQGSLSDAADGVGATYIGVALLGERYEKTPDDRPIPAEDSLRRQIFEQGGQYHFGVEHDESYIGIDGYDQDLARHLKTLALAVRRPRRGEATFSMYRSALIHANEALEPSDDESFRKLINRAVFGARHPYARPPYGTAPALKELGLGAVIDRQEALLQPAKATLLVVGRTEPLTVRRYSEQALGRWRASAQPPLTRRAPKAKPPSRPVALQLPLAHAALITVCGARPLGDIRGKEEALELTSRILGGGFGARLHQALRQEQGLAYASSAELIVRRHAKALLACTQVDRAKGPKALLTLQTVVDSLRSDPIREEELRRARALMVADMALARAEPEYFIQSWHEALIGGRLLEDRTEAIRAVTLEQVRAVANKIMRPPQWRILLAGHPRYIAATARAAGLRPQPFNNP